MYIFYVGKIHRLCFCTLGSNFVLDIERQNYWDLAFRVLPTHTKIDYKQPFTKVRTKESTIHDTAENTVLLYFQAKFLLLKGLVFVAVV